MILSKRHEHAGKQYPAGETIDVSKPTADWLMEHKIAKPSDGASKKETK